ncbi:hypothetical protein ES692_09915 [Psychroserpens burtonensis]|uniref:DUF4168 domain-containing protein n=1 Tax=Psychroserpens burtonensis TaxID=49278 RepID=A0A5C7B833_9FLAO|nr:hypothetical protein [Psychroserpens burtonensis]TXE17291.1 hypothetical protein ES692_09915 [Psychroserpens burtonensis]
MKTLLISIFCSVIFISNGFSQAAEEKQRLKYEAEMEQKKKEYINDFVTTLKVDDFQKEIIKQQMESYFEEFKKINMLGLQEFERKTYVQNLDDSHFSDLKAMITEDQMSKIMNALKGKWDPKEEEKKKKRKKKNKS